MVTYIFQRTGEFSELESRPYQWLILLFICLGATATVQGKTPNVLVSIKPIHSLVSGVMQGVDTPELLLTSEQSPHSYSLRPSDVRKLNTADLIFWVGEELETPLTHTLAANASQAEVVELMKLPEIERLSVRHSGVWEKQDHSNEHEETAEHHHHSYDPHIWLSPPNAGRIVSLAQKKLGEIDPQHAQAYRENADSMLQRLQDLDRKIRQQALEIRAFPYIVFHDAYHYFEHHYQLNGVGSVTFSPERTPGIKRIHELRKKLVDSGAVCIFSEPQFEPKLVRTIIEGRSVRTGVLDPMGSGLKPGPELYFELMQNLADSFAQCLLSR